MEIHQIHASQRRVSCELCRKNKAKCRRLKPDDVKCLRCTLNNLACHSGQQRKVGRPKRKEIDSHPAGESCTAKKRWKRTDHPELTLSAATELDHQKHPSARAITGGLELYGPSTQIHTAEHVPSRAHAGPQVRSLVSTSISRGQDLGWLGWPTFMTDRWCHEMLPGAARHGTVTELETISSPDVSANSPSASEMQATPNITSPYIQSATPSGLDRTWFKASRVRNDAGRLINPRLPTTYGLVRKNVPLPFGIGRTPAYYIRGRGFSSYPSGLIRRDVDFDGADSLVKLTEIIYGLQLRRTLVLAHRSRLSFTLLTHRKGPLFIEDHPLCEYVIGTAQELQRIVALLLHRPQTARVPDEHLSARPISAVIEVYCHLLSFFQLFLEHLTDRVERHGHNPVIPIPGLAFNGVVLTSSCEQGVLFSSSTFYLLGRLENAIGLNPTLAEPGLLSKHQINVLFDNLDGSDDLARSKGIMRPADLRKLYARVAVVLEQLANISE